MYNVIQLNTRNPVVPPCTLGIEITVHEVAARCDLGNIDEQHGTAAAGRAACEAALSWPLPPAGSNLAILIPDLDSLVAVAVLRLRAQGENLDQPSIAERIHEVAAGDRFEDGRRCGVRPLTRAAACITGSRETPVETKLAEIGEWVLNGTIGPEMHAAMERAAARDVAVSAALSTARVVHGIAVLDNAEMVGVSDLYPLSTRTPAMAIAWYSKYEWPGGAITTKCTIGWGSPPGAEVVQRVVDALNAISPGWGGNLNSGILGSPQGRDVPMTLGQVLLAVVEAAS